MREIKKIKLNEFSKNELDQRKMNTLKGGRRCACLVDTWTCNCGCWGSIDAYIETLIISDGLGNMPDDYMY